MSVIKPTESQLRSEIIATGQKLFDRDFVAATSGNISLRLDSGLFLVTPSNMSKGSMKEEDILVVDGAGKVRFGRRKLTSEFLMHRRIYERRPDVCAVVHAHPPIATGFACAGISLDQAIAAEAILALGKVPLAPYATPGTPEVPESLDPYIGESGAILLANHGVVAYGRDLAEAFGRMEIVEHYAKITLVAKLLGRQQILSQDEIAKLMGARSAYFK